MILFKKISELLSNKNSFLIIICILSSSIGTVNAQKSKGTFYTNVYPNTFKLAGYSEADIDTKVDTFARNAKYNA